MALFSKGVSPDGYGLLKQGKFKHAAKVLELKVRRNPSDLYARLRLAEAYRGSGRPEQAAAIYIEEADSRLAGGDHAAAAAFLKKALEACPDDLGVRDRLKEIDWAGQAGRTSEDTFSFDLDADAAPDKGGPSAEEPGVGGGAKDEGRGDRRDCFLRAVFPALDEGRLHALRSHVRAVALDTGEVLIREGDGGTSLFLIEKGHFEVRARFEQGERALAKLGPGDVIGEVALLREVPRTATVMAIEPSSVLEMLVSKTEAAAKLGEGWDDRLAGILNERLAGTLELLKEGGKIQHGDIKG